MNASNSIACRCGLVMAALTIASPMPALPRSGSLAQAPATAPRPYDSNQTSGKSTKDVIIMADNTRSTTGATEMAAAKTITTKILAIGTWTAKATPETRPAIMPFEARDTLRLQLAGKIDQWFAKTDGSGAVFLMNVTDPAEAHRLLEDLPLGKANMMTFELIPVGPLWPLGLMLAEPAK